LDTAIHFAASLAGIEGEPRVIRLEEPPLSLFSLVHRLGAAAARLQRGWARSSGFPKPGYVLR